MQNLKLLNAATTASNAGHSSAGLKATRQSTQGSTGSGSSSHIPNLSGIIANQVYSRSTSRGAKEQAHYNPASKISAMVGKPSSFIAPLAVRNAINATQIPSTLSVSGTMQGAAAHYK